MHTHLHTNNPMKVSWHIFWLKIIEISFDLKQIKLTPILNAGHKTIFQNLEQQFEPYSVQIKITTYIELCKYFAWREDEDEKNGWFP